LIEQAADCGCRYHSEETDIACRVSRCGDELARTALYEAANILLGGGSDCGHIGGIAFRLPNPKGASAKK